MQLESGQPDVQLFHGSSKVGGSVLHGGAATRPCLLPVDAL